MRCKFCNSPVERGYYCPACYAYLRKHPEGFPSSLPSKGSLIFNERGEAQCHICGLFFRKLGNHIAFKHHLSITHYKDTYKLYHTQSLCGDDYKNLMRRYTKKYYRRVVKRNLLKRGKSTRFIIGQEVEGRGKHIKREED